MTNPNPFVPKGSLLEQQGARRSRLKIAVTCVLAVSVLGLVGMLIQGCKREAPVENPLPELPTNSASMFDSTNPPVVDTNPIAMPTFPTNPPSYVPPVVPEAVPGTTHKIAKGDTLESLHKKYGVSVKAIEAANPGLDPKRLKIGKEITIPAATPSAAVPTAGLTPVADAGGELYTIKSGDTLDKIAKAHHTTAKAIQAANNLTTTKILVGHKLKIPASATPVPAPAVEAPVIPMTPAPVVPAPAPAPVK